MVDTSEYYALRTDNDLVEQGYNSFCSGLNNSVYVNCPANGAFALEEEDPLGKVLENCYATGTPIPHSGVLGSKVLQQGYLVVLGFILLLSYWL
jgi:hypothetical protein